MLSSCWAGVVQLLSESTIKLVTNVLGGERKKGIERDREENRRRVSRQDKTMLQRARKTLNDHKGKQKSRSYQIVDRLATQDKLFKCAHLLCATFSIILLTRPGIDQFLKALSSYITKKKKTNI